MDDLIPLVFELLTLLAGSYKIYLRNGRLMAFLAVLIISLHSFLFIFNAFCVTPWITDSIRSQTYQLALAIPGTPEFVKSLIGMQKYFKIFVSTELLLLLISAIGSLFFAISITYASALIHGGKMISIKDVVSWTVESFKKPLITSFYITLFVFGYFTFSLIATLPVFWVIPGVTSDQLGPSVLTIALFGIPAVMFISYLSIVWNLSFVISILEDKFGIQALGKAARIVKGIKSQGFILNVLLNVLSLALMQCLRWMNLNQPVHIRTAIALAVVSSISMVTMFGHTAHTVLYYRCKMNHGEQIELEGADAEYTKIPDAQLLNESVP